MAAISENRYRTWLSHGRSSRPRAAGFVIALLPLALLAGSIGASAQGSSTAVSTGLGQIWDGIGSGVTFKPKVQPKGDDGNCNVSSELTNNWLSRTKHLKTLQAYFQSAYDKIIPDEDVSLFGAEGGSKQQKNRENAKQELGEAGLKLLEIAQKYAALEMKSCDRCRVGNALGALVYISKQQENRIIGLKDLLPVHSEGKEGFLYKSSEVKGVTPALELKKLTRNQVEKDSDNPTTSVVKLVERHKKIEAKLSSFSFTKPSDELMSCQSTYQAGGFIKNDPDPRICDRTFAEMWLSRINDMLYDTLAVKSADDTSQPAYDYWQKKPAGTLGGSKSLVCVASSGLFNDVLKLYPVYGQVPE